MESEWGTAIIEDFADVKSGKRLPKSDTLVSTKTDYPYIRLVDISNGKIRTENLLYLEPETRNKISRYIVNKGDVCFAIVGHTIGMVFYVEEDFDGVNLTENAARITNISDEFDSKFLYYYFTSKEGQNEILSRNVGSAQGKLPLYNIRSMPVPKPPVLIQKEIAHILGILDDKIELNRQMNETLEAMAQALFKSWFVDFDPVIDNALAAGNEIPEPLQTRATAREALGDQRKPLPADIQSLFPDRFVFTDEMGWIPKGWVPSKLGDLSDLNWGDTNTTKKAYVEHGYKAYSAKGPDGNLPYFDFERTGVVVSAIGANSGFTWLAKGKWSCIKNTIRFWSIDSAISTEYLFFATHGNEKWPLRGSAQPFISQADARNLKVLKPNDKAVDVFTKSVSMWFDEMQNNSLQAETLGALRDTLLPKLLSGELSITEPEQQVAEAL
nr:restriction endonuclease subunit S [uncultured Methylophaga sp.]